MLGRIGSVMGYVVGLIGDLPSSSQDSRQFGCVPLDDLRGRVIWTY